MRRGTTLSRSAAARALKRIAKDAPLKYGSLTSALRRSVHIHWGSMAAARDALGLQHLPAPRQRWNQERVIAEIKRLARTGVHMSVNAVVKAGRNDLLAAAQTYVGSWTRARDLARVRFRRRKVVRLPVWNPAEVVLAIQERHRRDEPLAPSKVPKPLLCAANRYWGSWRKAIIAAGLDYEQILLLRRVSDTEMLMWLRGLAVAHPNMTLFDIDKYGEHAVACRRRWGSYEAAAKAAGISDWPMRERYRSMPRRVVIRKLRALAAQRRSLHIKLVAKYKGGQQLVTSALHHFPTWGEALREAKVGRSQVTEAP